MKYDTIIFDLDGTLLDTLEDLADSVNYVLGQYNQPQHSIDDIRRFVGNGIRNLMIRSIPNGEACDTFEEEFELFKEYYLQHCRIKTGPYRGIIEVMEQLKENGVKMAICSNKNQAAVEELADYYFVGLCDVAIGADSSREIKPAPDGVYAAIEGLEAHSETTLYVGDSEVDGKTAENAGLDCVLVSWGFRDKEQIEMYPHIALIDEPEELLAIILE